MQKKIFTPLFNAFTPVIYITWDIAACKSATIPPDCIILENWVSEILYWWIFYNDEPFTKPLQIFETCVSVSDNLCEKLVLSLKFPVKFGKIFKFILLPFFIADLNLLSF